MSVTHDICTSLEEFSGVLFSTREQYADFGQVRQNKDAADINLTCNHKKVEDLKLYMENKSGPSQLVLFGEAWMRKSSK